MFAGMRPDLMGLAISVISIPIGVAPYILPWWGITVKPWQLYAASFGALLLLVVGLGLLTYTLWPRRIRLRNPFAVQGPEEEADADIIFRDADTGRVWRFSEVSALTENEKTRLKEKRPDVWRAYNGRLFRDVILPPEYRNRG